MQRQKARVLEEEQTVVVEGEMDSTGGETIAAGGDDTFTGGTVTGGGDTGLLAWLWHGK